MEKVIKSYYEDLSIVYPEALVRATADNVDSPMLMGELSEAYELFKESRWMKMMVEGQRFKGIAERMKEFIDRSFEIDRNINLLQYSMSQEKFERTGLTLEDIKIHSQGHSLFLQEISDAIKHLQHGTKGSMELRTIDITACVLLLAQEAYYLEGQADLEDIQWNTSVHILPVTNLADFRVHTRVDKGLFLKTAIQHQNASEVERLGLTEATSIADVALQTSKALVIADELSIIYDKMARFEKLASIEENRFRKPSTSTLVKKRSDWLDDPYDTDQSAYAKIPFNPHWRCITRIVNIGDFHWILLVIVRHGPALQNVSCVVFDSLNLWRKNKEIAAKSIPAMVSTILSCNAMGMATLGDRGAIPRLINGFQKKNQDDSTTCGVHALSALHHVVSYFSRKTKKPGSDDDPNVDPNHGMDWPNFTVSQFIDYMNDIPISDASCNGVVRQSFVRGLKFVSIFAHLMHHLTSSPIYSKGAVTKQNLIDNLEKDRSEYELLDITLNFACINGPEERPQVLRLDGDVAKSTFNQIISQCTLSASERASRKVYDIRKKRVVPSNAVIIVYIKDVYKKEITDSKLNRRELLFDFLVIDKDVQGEDVLKTAYDKVIFEIDTGNSAEKKTFKFKPAQAPTYGMTLEDFKNLMVTVKTAIPGGDHARSHVHYFNKTTKQHLSVLNDMDIEVSDVPLVTLGEFHNGDAISMILMSPQTRAVVLGFSTPFTERTMHVVELYNEDLDGNPNTSLAEIIKMSVANTPISKLKFSTLLAQYDVFNDLGEILSEEELYLTWPAYVAVRRMELTSDENLGYLASGSVFVMLVARKGAQIPETVSMTVRGIDTDNNEYGPISIDNVSLFMRLSEFTAHIKRINDLTDEKRPLYYYYIEPTDIIKDQISLVTPNKLKKFRENGIADPILIHLGFYDANPKKHHVHFYMDSS